MNNHGYDILTLFDILPNFLFAKKKQSVIVINKLSIYELPHKMPNDLELMILGNQEISEKSQNFIELWPSAPPYSQNGNTTKKLPKKTDFSCKSQS